MIGGTNSVTEDSKDEHRDFEYDIFGHLILDMEHSMLAKKIKMNSEKIVDERKVCVRKYMGKKKITSVEDPEIKAELETEGFFEQKMEIDEKANTIRGNYRKNKRSEECADQFFALMREANLEKTNYLVLDGVSADGFIDREKTSERQVNQESGVNKNTRLFSMIGMYLYYRNTWYL